MKKNSLWLACLFILFFLLSACSADTTGSTTSSSSTAINVVAAENFYGDIVKQLGGSHVSVTSILSDPNLIHDRI